MKRYYVIFIDFEIDTECNTFSMVFSSDWRSTEILDYMCDNFAINRDNIIETRCTFVKRYKLSKDA